MGLPLTPEQLAELRRLDERAYLTADDDLLLRIARDALPRLLDEVKRLWTTRDLYAEQMNCQVDRIVALERERDEARVAYHTLQKRLDDQQVELGAALMARDEARAQARQSLIVLRALSGLLDDGTLVRDISRDTESDWALRQLPLLQILTDLNAVLAAFDAAPWSKD